MAWWSGFSTCSQLGVDGCVVWWEAWAVVAAAAGLLVAAMALAVGAAGVLATLAAVYVALTAARDERRKSIELQEREWTRFDAARHLKASRLAHAFNRDLVRAYQELAVDRRNRRSALASRNSDAVLDYLLNRRPVIDLPMIDRFANELDGFADSDALALLNALSGAKDVSRKVDVPAVELGSNRAFAMAENIGVKADVFMKEVVKLNDRMLEYLAGFPHLTLVDNDVTG